MERFEVSNVQEAVELAGRLKTDGRYNWFRGQYREWPPWPSLLRAYAENDEETVKSTLRRIELFWRFTQDTPQLRFLTSPEKEHHFYAILQHYGVPTCYLDFTTDPGVAGFFAADAKTRSNDGTSCIYCLDTDELLDIWSAIHRVDELRKQKRIETVTIELTNLWRLEAQSGVFLFVDYNWEVDFGMDRIVFPSGGYPAAPTRDRIYPEHRSELEQLLDQYFDLDRRDSRRLELGKLIENSRRGEFNPVTVVLIPPMFEGARQSAFRGTCPGIVQSWVHEDKNRWTPAMDATFQGAVGKTRRLPIAAGSSPSALKSAVEFGVMQSMRSTVSLRNFAIEWLLPGLGDEGPILEPLLARTWNGMRLLPYSDDEIAESMSQVAFIRKSGYRTELCDREQIAVLEQHFGVGLAVEFGTRQGGDQWAWVPEKSVISAIRPDLHELLSQEDAWRASDMKALFHVIHNPRRLFEFDPFKTLFLRFCIPIQVMDGRPFVLFSPVDVEAFGNP
jgi:hypothetical protein